MQTFRRGAAGLSRQARSLSRQQPRRYAHDAHDSTHQSAPGPSSESFGLGFYIALAALPASYLMFRVSAQGTDQQPYLTRVINSTDSWRQQWQERNDLHTQAMEQAAHDRNLFLNSAGSRHVDLKFPEILNSGSPWNVPAGHGADLNDAIARFEKEAYAIQAKKLEDLKAGNIRAEQEYTPPARLPKGTSPF